MAATHGSDAIISFLKVDEETQILGAHPILTLSLDKYLG